MLITSTPFTDFKSKKIRVNLNLPMKSEQKAESNDVMKTVDEDRRMLLQATIVRIMKARKTLKHAQLIQEVVQQVQSRFQPKIPDIKKAIDQLLDVSALPDKHLKIILLIFSFFSWLAERLH